MTKIDTLISSVRHLNELKQDIDDYIEIATQDDYLKAKRLMLASSNNRSLGNSTESATVWHEELEHKIRNKQKEIDLQRVMMAIVINGMRCELRSSTTEMLLDFYVRDIGSTAMAKKHGVKYISTLKRIIKKEVSEDE